MPILDVEIIGSLPAERRNGLARRIADAVGTALESRPQGTWVKLRFLDAGAYAENAAGPPEDTQPVFVSVLLAHPPQGDQLADQVMRLTAAIAEACGRPSSSVHLAFEPAAAGRISFGGVRQPGLKRTLVPSNSPFASVIGFSRAVRVGDIISVGGTAALDDHGNTVGVGDPAAQARRCYEIIRLALEEAGSGLGQVTRTRTLLTRIEDWEPVAKVRGEFFQDVRPVDTVVAVSGFINPEWLVEIEVDAIITPE